MPHTPGPWTHDEVRTQVGRAFRIGTSEMLQAGKGCCIIYDDYPSGEKSEQRKANAELITAAPDLYEALKDIMELYGPGTLATEEIYDKACRALSKAQGKQN